MEQLPGLGIWHPFCGVARVRSLFVVSWLVYRCFFRSHHSKHVCMSMERWGDRSNGAMVEQGNVELSDAWKVRSDLMCAYVRLCWNLCICDGKSMCTLVAVPFRNPLQVLPQELKARLITCQPLHTIPTVATQRRKELKPSNTLSPLLCYFPYFPRNLCRSSFSRSSAIISSPNPNPH